MIGVPFAAAVPLLWMSYGTRAALPAAVVPAVGFVFVHAVLLDWRRIPFTCSYLPGKRFIGHSALVGVAACVLFTMASGGVPHLATADRKLGLIVVASLFLIGYWLREKRILTWMKTPLMFEDEFPDQPLQLQL